VHRTWVAAGGPPPCGYSPDRSRWGVLLPVGMLLSVFVFGAEAIAEPGHSSSPSQLEPPSRIPSPTSAVNAASQLKVGKSLYRIGVGDVLRIRLYGMDPLLAVEIPVAPDGTVNYLQAKDVRAAGLTVSELKRAISSSLSSYRKNAKVIVIPVKLNSKRYTILGSVRERGTFLLEKTTTLLDAIALSSGFQQTEGPEGVFAFADLNRSFVIRHGKRVPVDIERLYKFGDLRHNIILEPNDYIYMASNQNRNAYILGAVVKPGQLQLSSPTTVTGAIAMASGFDRKKAWKQRVLLVRGSITTPKSKAINIKAVLSGRQDDPLLEPGDIVYVHTKPWAFAEDILDVAVQSFIQGAVISVIEGEPPVSVGRF
jgi:polysaccharide export outer membrane protein